VSARAIVSGVLRRAPETRTSKSGKSYILATIREKHGETARWWRSFVFDEAAFHEITRLNAGDPVAVSGEFECETYAPACGESRLSWSIRADAILSAKAKPKAKGRGQ
jgi:Single-strand binding protein family